LNRREFFSTTYYASGGKVLVRDLVSVIETFFIQNNYSYRAIALNIEAGEDVESATLNIIYCHFRLFSKSAESFLTGNFFTTASSRMVTLDCPQYLAGYFGKGRHSVSVSAIVKLPNGSTRAVNYSYSINAITNRVMTLSIIPAEIESELSTSLHMDVKLLQFSYTIGSRRCHFFIQRVPFARCFYFWNAFNCKETIAFPSETITELETDFSEAVIEHRLQQYDVEHSYSYETQTGDLLSNQTSWIEQFLTSPKILLAQTINGENPTVLIVDYEHKVTDAPGNSNQINFKWKFADKRLTLNDFILDDGIFTEQYTEEYV